MKFLKILVLALLLINLAMLAFAFGPMAIGPKKGIQQQFDFNEEQMAHFEESRDEIRAKLEQLNPKLKDLSKDYYTLDVDATKEEIMLGEIDQINHEIYRAHLKHFQDIRGICTPEQREKLPEFIDILMNGGGERGARGPKRRKGDD